MKNKFAFYGLLMLMSSIFFSSCQKDLNQVIAHRGAWKTLNMPENSIASLKQAIALGCYGSEFDVRMTKDDIMVVNHDPDFLGMHIEKSTYQELLQKKLPNGESIPTLKAYLEEGLKQKKTKLVLEVKSSPSGKERTLKLTKMAVELVHELKGRKAVEYICFDYDAGKLIHELDPKAPVSYLNGDVTPTKSKADGYTGLDYNLKVFQAKPEWITEAKAAGLILNVWTVNQEKDMKEMLSKGIDFITTNEPEKLFEILKEKK